MNSSSKVSVCLLFIVFLFIPNTFYGMEKNAWQVLNEKSVLCKAEITTYFSEKDLVVASASKPVHVCGRKTDRLLHPIIHRAANRHKVDPAIIKAIIKAESGCNPRAVSKKGAMGLMQLMPRTAESLGVEDGFDPEQNIEGGTKYFKQLLKQFGGEVRLALAAYNSGSRKVRKYQGVPPFKSTKRYIRNVLKYYQQYKD